MGAFFPSPLGVSSPDTASAAGIDKPPPRLACQGSTYHCEDTTEGTHEDDSGERVPKITSDYWDSGRRQNLAVERWPESSFDAYLGTYIEPG